VSAVIQESITEAIVHLTNAPLRLRALLDGMDPAKLRARPKPGLFSPLEEKRTLDLRTLIRSMVEHDHGHLYCIEGIYVTSVAA
jgi:hypothetical protein